MTTSIGSWEGSNLFSLLKLIFKDDGFVSGMAAPGGLIKKNKISAACGRAMTAFFFPPGRQPVFYRYTTNQHRRTFFSGFNSNLL